MDSLVKVEHINSLNKARQKKYYQANKEQINKSKRNLREVKSVIPNINLFDEDTVNKLVNEMEINENTKRKHLSNIKIIFMIYPTKNLEFSLKHFDEIKTRLVNMCQIKNPDKKYSLETQKGIIQTIWWLITKLNIPINEEIFKKYENLVSVLKQKSVEKKLEHKNDIENAVIPYSDYLKLIMDKYGNDSMEYIISLLYESITARDDLATLMIVEAMRYASDTSKNYIVIPKTGKTRIILNAYKTSNQYGKITAILSKDTANSVKTFIKTNALKTMLFPKYYKNGLTSIISKMNKSVGINGGINSIRRMKTTDFLQNPNLTIDDRVKQATASGHSISQQELYNYQQKSSI